MRVLDLYNSDGSLRSSLFDEGWDATVKIAEILQQAADQGGLAGTRVVGQWQSDSVSRSQSIDWYLAFRGYSFIVSAKVNATNRNPCCFKVSFTGTIANQYNFDQGNTFGFNLPTGTELQRLHKTGLARNFLAFGKLETEGTHKVCLSSDGTAFEAESGLELNTYLQES